MTTNRKRNVAKPMCEVAPMLGLGQRIKDVRLKQGLTQAEFAARLGVSRSYLSEAERGKSKPSVEMLVGIAGQFGDVSLRWLLTGSHADPQTLAIADIDEDLLQIAAYKATQWIEETNISTGHDNVFLGLSVMYRDVLTDFDALRSRGLPREKIISELRRRYGMPARQRA